MTKQEIYNFLRKKNIEFEITEHKAVYNMKEVTEIEIPYPEAEAKNLFLRDDKKRNYYLVTIKGDKKVDLKKLRQENGMCPLSFASKEELLNILQLTPGSVTPLGILNEKNAIVQFFLDEEFLKEQQLIGVHPNDNTATIWLKVTDLITIIKEHGNSIQIVEI